jgi:transposase
MPVYDDLSNGDRIAKEAVMGYGIKLTEKQWNELDNLRFTTPSADVFRNCLIILMSNSHDTIATIAQHLGCGTDTVVRIRRLYRRGGISAADERSGAYQSAYTGVWFFNVVCGSFGRAFSEGNWNSFQQRSDNQITASPRFFGASSETYTQGQTRRNRIRKGQESPYPLEKKAMKPDATEALVFQDETEIHRHPILTRMWWTKGSQPQVPSPGENQKKVVYGGIDYATGRITCTVADTKSGYNFLVFLIALVTAYAGRKIRLVCDNGRFHHTRAVKQWLKDHKDVIQIFWLPPYCPSLNLIERLWGHLKRTVIANVLFETMDDLVTAFRRGVSKVNGHRNRMGFIFDHDDVKTKAA